MWVLAISLRGRQFIVAETIRAYVCRKYDASSNDTTTKHIQIGEMLRAVRVPFLGVGRISRTGEAVCYKRYFVLPGQSMIIM